MRAGAPRPALANPAPATVAEARFVVLLNDLRARNGRGPLAVDGRLHASAQAWALRLAHEGALRHQDIGRFLGAWSTAAENVAFGPNVDAMFRALAASPRHYGNIVKGEFSAVGIGVVPAADGTLWTSHLLAG